MARDDLGGGTSTSQIVLLAVGLFMVPLGLHFSGATRTVTVFVELQRGTLLPRGQFAGLQVLETQGLHRHTRSQS